MSDVLYVRHYTMSYSWSRCTILAQGHPVHGAVLWTIVRLAYISATALWRDVAVCLPFVAHVRCNYALHDSLALRWESDFQAEMTFARPGVVSPCSMAEWSSCKNSFSWPALVIVVCNLYAKSHFAGQIQAIIYSYPIGDSCSIHRAMYISWEKYTYIQLHPSNT